jgi:hypothetical protein
LDRNADMARQQPRRADPPRVGERIIAIAGAEIRRRNQGLVGRTVRYSFMALKGNCTNADESEVSHCKRDARDGRVHLRFQQHKIGVRKSCSISDCSK